MSRDTRHKTTVFDTHFLRPDLDFRLGPTRISIDFSPLWFLLSLAGMVFLLALELVDRIRVRDELEIARQLQRDLLPQRSPTIPGYRIGHS